MGAHLHISPNTFVMGVTVANYRQIEYKNCRTVKTNYFTDERDFMKIDCHVHARERSGCATVDEQGQIRAAITAGLDGLVFTDHNRLVPQERLAFLNEKFAPFHIFTGIEVDADNEHWVVLGVHDPALEQPGWRYIDLLEFVHSRGGFITLAHPFRYVPQIRVDIEKYPPDGIEYRSINTPKAREAEILSLAARCGMLPFSNSDGHHPGGVASYYNVLPQSVQTDQELIEILQGMKPNIDHQVLASKVDQPLTVIS